MVEFVSQTRDPVSVQPDSLELNAIKHVQRVAMVWTVLMCQRVGQE